MPTRKTGKGQNWLLNICKTSPTDKSRLVTGKTSYDPKLVSMVLNLVFFWGQTLKSNDILVTLAVFNCIAIFSETRQKLIELTIFIQRQSYSEHHKTMQLAVKKWPYCRTLNGLRPKNECINALILFCSVLHRWRFCEWNFRVSRHICTKYTNVNQKRSQKLILWRKDDIWYPLSCIFELVWTTLLFCTSSSL